MTIPLDEIGLLLTRAAVIWVIWELGRALRQTSRPQLVRDTEHVRASLEKVRGLLHGIEERMAKSATAKENRATNRNGDQKPIEILPASRA